MIKWIPVSERLPKPESIVDVYIEWVGRDENRYGKRLANVEYYPDVTSPWIMEDGDAISYFSEVTHWMPLPEPPETET